MKVCIINGIYAQTNDGIGRYSKNLKLSLLSGKNVNIIEVPNQKQVILKAGKVVGIGKYIPSNIKRITNNILLEKNYLNRFINNRYHLCEQVKEIQADIYHAISPSEAPAAVLTGKKPFVTTVHDIIPLINPPRFLLEKFYFNEYMKMALKSNMIISDSKSTRNDLISFLPVDQSKIAIVYPSIEETYIPLKEKRPNKFFTFIFVGGLTKRKGIYETVKAFRELYNINQNIRLRIIGEGEEVHNIVRLINRMGIENSVSVEGFLSENALIKAYQESDALVYPSKYEGFGYTPLEAMSCGLPVITSNVSSIPEVVGNCGILVDPDNIAQIATAMKEVLNNEQKRSLMREKGLSQSRKFTWNRTVDSLFQIYNEVLQRAI